MGGETPLLQDAPDSTGTSTVLHKRGCFIQQLSMDEIHSPPSAPQSGKHVSSTAMSLSASVRASAAGALPCTPPVQTPFPCTPSPSGEGARSLPRLLGRVNTQPHFAGMTKKARPSVLGSNAGQASAGTGLEGHLVNESR